MPSLSFSTAIGVLVVHPAERLLVEVDLRRSSRRLGRLDAQPARDLARRVFSSFSSRSGLMVSRSQPARCDDLLDLAEARPHDLGLVAELLEVVVDPRHRRDARVLVGGDVRDAAFLLVPVVDAADERRDQRDPGLGAGDRLGEAEQQRQVAVDALVLELLGGPDALPGAGDLDQDALAVDARLLVHADQLAGLGQGALGVEAEAGIDLGRDAAGDDLEDLAAEVDEQLVHERLGARGLVAGGVARRVAGPRRPGARTAASGPPGRAATGWWSRPAACTRRWPRCRRCRPPRSCSVSTIPADSCELTSHGFRARRRLSDRVCRFLWTGRVYDYLNVAFDCGLMTRMEDFKTLAAQLLHVVAGSAAADD